MMEASAKTTVEGGEGTMEDMGTSPGWKFHIEGDSGASEITEQYLARDEVTLADLLVPS